MHPVAPNAAPRSARQGGFRHGTAGGPGGNGGNAQGPASTCEQGYGFTLAGVTLSANTATGERLVAAPGCRARRWRPTVVPMAAPGENGGNGGKGGNGGDAQGGCRLYRRHRAYCHLDQRHPGRQHRPGRSWCRFGAAGGDGGNGGSGFRFSTSQLQLRRQRRKRRKRRFHGGNGGNGGRGRGGGLLY